MYIILNTVPTLILILILHFRKHHIKEELRNLLDNHFLDDIITSAWISFMGFNILTSLSSIIINSETTTQTHTSTPIIYVYAILFSPVFEELICRKHLLLKLNKHISFTLAALIISIVFSVLHFNLAGFIGYIFIGMVWSHYYRKTNNILIPIISHSLFNYTTLLIISLRGGG